MNIRKRLLALTAATAALALPLAANAHRAWLVPSATILSGDGAWVTVDAAISNELFYPDHRAMRVDGVVITTPDGSTEPLKNAATGQYRSVFDVELAKPGTYKIGSASASVMASWTEGGETKRFRGSAEDFAKQVPAGAADLKTIRSFNRNETFVTRGAPTDTVLKPTGKGLELVPVTHPNDVVAGEAATFKFLVDGKPAADLEVTFVPGNSRYRASPGEIKVKTGPDGAVKFTLPEAGMYWMNASVRTGETGRGGMGGPPGGGMGGGAPGGAPPAGGPQGGPPAGGPGAGPGGPGGGTGPLAGNGFSASYTATFEAQRP